MYYQPKVTASHTKLYSSWEFLLFIDLSGMLRCWTNGCRFAFLHNFDCSPRNFGQLWVRSWHRGSASCRKSATPLANVQFFPCATQLHNCKLKLSPLPPFAFVVSAIHVQAGHSWTKCRALATCILPWNGNSSCFVDSIFTWIEIMQYWSSALAEDYQL